MMEYRKYGIMFLIAVFAGLFVMNPVYAAEEEGSMITDTLKTSGLLAASFLGPGLVTQIIAGGNQSASATSGLSSGLGTAGALVGGGLLGAAGGMWLGGIGALAGGVWGAFNFANSNPLYSLDRGIVTRVISLDINNGDVYDTDYKIKGSDSPSDKFDAEFKKDKQFFKKEKGVEYQYIPVKINNDDKAAKSRNQVEVADLVITTYGLQDQTNNNVANPGLATGTNALANSYGQYGNGMQNQYMSVAGTTDPYANAFRLGEEADQSIGWCHVKDEGALSKKDDDVSQLYVETVIEKQKKEGQESFILLLKNLNPLLENIDIPSFNCFGPNGLTGVTGPEYKPKVEFAWTWDEVGYYWNDNVPSGDGETTTSVDYCSRTLDDNDRIYCDSTQFMESLFTRLQKISNELQNLDNINFTSTADMNVDVTTKKVSKLLTYRASLMKDGYTLDFLTDFKEYVTQKTFLNFNAQKNLAATMLPNKISFRPLNGVNDNPEGYKLPYAGYYNVNIEVLYNTPGDYQIMDQSWNLESNVKQIIVYFEPISQETNPVYYMPLDATVGVTDAGIIDRIGYGVDYSGDSIWFRRNANDNILLEPTLRSNSTPIVHLDMTTIQDVATLNGIMGGTVLQILPKSGSITPAYNVRRYLSLPGVVNMKVTKKTDGDAYAFYTVDFGQGPENAGNSFILWNLVCKDGSFNCESFSGLKPTDEMYLPDMIGAKASVAPTGQLKGKVYGLEWEKDIIIRDGKHNEANYKGLVYMPESFGGNLNISKVIASDDVTFDWGVTPYTSLRDISEIYDMVDAKIMCMSVDQGGVGVRFWWNPEAVMKFTRN